LALAEERFHASGESCHASWARGLASGFVGLAAPRGATIDRAPSGLLDRATPGEHLQSLKVRLRIVAWRRRRHHPAWLRLSSTILAVSDDDKR